MISKELHLFSKNSPLVSLRVPAKRDIAENLVFMI